MYQTVLVGTKETFSVPFTYTGDATYQDGSVGAVDGGGMFDADDTGVFHVDVICVMQPGGCGYGLPPSESGLPTGFLAPGEAVVEVLPEPRSPNHRPGR